jgi:hypothetical protein
LFDADLDSGQPSENMSSKRRVTFLKTLIHQALLAACGLLVSMSAAKRTDAQESGLGGWVAAAVGPGWNTSHGSSPAARGFSYTGRGGLTFGRHLGVGVELAAWWTSLGSDISATNRLIIGTVQPSTHSLFFKVGAGFATAAVRRASTGERGRDNGVAFTVGVALELPVLPPISVGTNIDVNVQKFQPERDFPTTNSFLAVTVGLAYRKRGNG